ncbi:MAG: toprim domain-containing protein, partial [Gemmatimonadota bacterium]
MATKKINKTPAKPTPSPIPGKAATGKRVTATAVADPKPATRKRASRAKPPEAEVAEGSGGTLVIVESPTKAKSIGKYLGRGYDVKATIGHIRDLPTRKLGVDVENGFLPDYVTIKGKTQTLADLKKA